MIRKLFLTPMIASALFFAGCSDSKDEKSKDKDFEKTTQEDAKKEDDDLGSNSSDMNKAAVALCDCFKQHAPEIDPVVEKILMKAADSDNPIMTLQNEFMKIENEDDRNRLSESFENIDKNKDMEACGDKVKAKYNIKEKDKKTERAILIALEENNDCPLLAAMSKIALKMPIDKDNTNNEE